MYTLAARWRQISRDDFFFKIFIFESNLQNMNAQVHLQATNEGQKVTA